MHMRATKADKQYKSSSLQPKLASSDPPSFSSRNHQNWQFIGKTWELLLLFSSILVIIMFLTVISLWILEIQFIFTGVDGTFGDWKHSNEQEARGFDYDPVRYKAACPDYRHYAVIPQYVQMPFLALQPC